MKINLPDAGIASVVLILILTAAFFLYRQDSSPRYLLITTVDGTEVYPLDKNRVWERTDEKGTVRVEIRDGTAAFTDSYCSGRDCIRTGNIVGRSGFAACLPARVRIETAGGGENADATAY